MRWPVFVIFVLIALVLETSMSRVLMIGSISPSFLVPLVVFVALSAPRRMALWSAWLVGLLADQFYFMLTPGGPMLPHVGPHALGYLFGAYLIVLLRTMVFRQRVVTLAVMALMATFASQLVVIALSVIRSWYPDGGFLWTNTTAFNELGRSLLMAVYTGILALPVGWVLVQLSPLWAFTGLGHRMAR